MAVVRLLIWLPFLLPMARSSGAGPELSIQRTLQNAEFPKSYRERVLAGPSGFPARIIYSFEQGPDGLIWLGTEMGLFRFDGIEFRQIREFGGGAVPPGDIRQLLVDSSGWMWLGTPEGLTVVSDEPGPLRGMPQLPRESILSLEEAARGGVWVGAASGLFRIRGGVVDHWGVGEGLGDRQVLAIAEVDDQTVWVGTREGAQKFNPSENSFGPVLVPNLPFQGPDIGDPYESAVGDFHVTSDGEVFGLFGLWPTPSFALHQFVEGVWERVFSEGETLEGHELVADQNNPRRFWITGAASCRLVDLELSFTRKFEPSGLIKSDYIMRLFAPSEDRFIMGVLDEGLHIYHRRLFHLIPMDERFRRGDSIRSIAPGQSDEIVIGADSGIYRLRNGELRAEEVQDQFEKNVIRSVLVAEDGSEWKGGKNGLFRRLPNGTEWHYVELTNRLLGQSVRVLFEDSRGGLWVGTPKGGVVLSASGQMSPFDRDSGLRGEDVRSLAEDARGRKWVATYDGGLQVLTPEGEFVQAYSIEDGLVSDQLESVSVDLYGRVWIGGAAGVSVLTDGVVQNFFGTSVIPSTASMVHADLKGLLWVGFPGGLLSVPSLDLKEWLENPAHKVRSRVFSQFNGLSVGEIRGGFGQPTLFENDEGEVWFAAEKGLVRADPNRMRSAPSWRALVPRFEELIADGRFLYKGGILATELPELSTTGTIGLLEASFTAPTIEEPGSVQLQCWLEGHEPDWLSLETDPSVRFTNLKPGEYQLHVATSYPFTSGLRRVSSLSLVVRPEIHQAMWFQIGCGVLLLTGLTGLYRWRVTFLRRIGRLESQDALHRERERIAADLHDELGGELQRVQILVERVSRSDRPRADRNRKALKRAVEDSQRSMRELMWATSPQTDSWQNLLMHLASMVERVAREAELRFRLHLPEKEMGFPVDVIVRRQVGLIVKEGLTNVVKHAQARSIELGVEKGENLDFIVIALRDDGRGLVGEAAQSDLYGNGLRSMKRRTQAIGGAIEFLSLVTGGVEVRIILPLNQNHD